MVKSGTRKKTSDLLIGCLIMFKGASPNGNVADRMSRSAKRHQEKSLLSMGYRAKAHQYLRHRNLQICRPDDRHNKNAAEGIAHAALKLAAGGPAFVRC
jgi:hypothetical protein